nr:hypothetical protein [uncultured Desulfobacter sp.]
MRRKLNGVWYDLSTASLIAETQSMTAFSGRISVGLYRSQDGQWLQYIRPTHGNDSQTISHWIGPNTAKSWLKKHNFSLQLQEYFGVSECRVWSERNILVAEKKSPNSTTSHDLIRVEKLYYHSRKGWCLQQIKESVLLPLTAHEAAKLARSLQQRNGHTQSSLPILKKYLYEGEPLQHRRIAS